MMYSRPVWVMTCGVTKNGLNRMTLGYWKDIQNKYIIVLVIASGFIAISFASVLYFRYFFNFVINRILLRKAYTANLIVGCQRLRKNIEQMLVN